MSAPFPLLGWRALDEIGHYRQARAAILRVLINRPQKRNAIDFDVREQMTQALLAARADSSVRAVVLGGVEGVFSAGGDLDSMEGLDEDGARTDEACS